MICLLVPWKYVSAIQGHRVHLMHENIQRWLYQLVSQLVDPWWKRMPFNLATSNPNVFDRNTHFHIPKVTNSSTSLSSRGWHFSHSKKYCIEHNGNSYTGFCYNLDPLIFENLLKSVQHLEIQKQSHNWSLQTIKNVQKTYLRAELWCKFHIPIVEPLTNWMTSEMHLNWGNCFPSTTVVVCDQTSITFVSTIKGLYVLDCKWSWMRWTP